MTEQFDYNATLNRMAGLDELTQFIAATSTASVANKRQLLSQIKKMADDISKVRDQIDAIKNKGAQANASIITVIKSANDKQKQSEQKGSTPKNPDTMLDYCQKINRQGLPF